MKRSFGKIRIPVLEKTKGLLDDMEEGMGMQG